MANVSTEVGDPDSQEVIMHQQLIAKLEPETMEIAILEQQLAKDEEKLKLQKKQSSESERLLPQVNVQKVSEKQPLQHQGSHRASKKIKKEPVPPEHSEGPSPIYYCEQQSGTDGSRETKWPQDRFDRRSQDRRGPDERYIDLPLAERSQLDENVSGRPGRDRNFNKQDRDREGQQIEDGPEDVRYDHSHGVCLSFPEKMEKYLKELHEIGNEIEDLIALLAKDDSVLKASEKYLKHNFNEQISRLRLHEDLLLKYPPVARNEPRFFSPLKHESLKTDSIEIEKYHIKRTELLDNAKTILRRHQFVVFCSPNASGKTSFLKILGHSLGIQTIYLSCANPFFSWENLCSGDGFDDRGIPFHLMKIDYDCIVMLDDAQAKYDNIRFWVCLIKVGQLTFPSNIHFIISATHMLSTGPMSSPIAFQSFQNLSRADFLLSEQEARQFLNSPEIGLPPVMLKPNLIDLIIRECAGLVGAMRLSVDALKIRFAKDVSPSESDLLAYYLSSECVQLAGRCFGVQHSAPIQDNFRFYLTRCFLGELMRSPNLLDEKDKQCFDLLQKCGVLIQKNNGAMEFSSPLARRYYSQWLFSPRSLNLPVSLVALVKTVIENMSASVLKQSTVDENNFPKEATFQHLWMQGLAQFTPITCSICPDLSKVFPFAATSSTSKTAGEIDFYVNGDLCWGIELLVNGNGITEHIDRFSECGKYFPLSVNDYAIVDFRQNMSGQATNINSHPKRHTVFFKSGDFSMCQCLFGLDEEPVTLILKA